jgi:hypothetical protein
MNQATLELVRPDTDTIDRTGFDIGWDHAHHGLVPPAELLHAATPVCQGWMAGRAVFNRRATGATRSTRSTRQWLQLRLLAWRHGIAFDGRQITPSHLEQIHAASCPVLRMPLGGLAGDASAAVVERLNPQAGCVAGTLAVMSLQAARAIVGVDTFAAVRRARLAESAGEPVGELDAAAWWRLATLRSFAMALPFHQAARLPLAALPPPCVEVINAVQRLQVHVTLQFTTPGWSARAREMAGLLPEHTLRHDFNLFVGALVPRLLEAGPGAQDQRRALEDAWLHERVQRRWQHFVLSLGETGVEALLERASAPGAAAMPTVRSRPARTTAGRPPAPGGPRTCAALPRRLSPTDPRQNPAAARPAR